MLAIEYAIHTCLVCLLAAAFRLTNLYAVSCHALHICSTPTYFRYSTTTTPKYNTIIIMITRATQITQVLILIFVLALIVHNVVAVPPQWMYRPPANVEDAVEDRIEHKKFNKRHITADADYEHAMGSALGTFEKQIVVSTYVYSNFFQMRLSETDEPDVSSFQPNNRTLCTRWVTRKRML